MKLVPMYLNDEHYPVNNLDFHKTELIVSRYPDRIEDLAFIKSFTNKIPIVVHLHLWYNFYNSTQKHILNETLQYANLRIANCRALGNQYKNIFPDYEWTYVNNGIDCSVFRPSTESERKQFKSINEIPVNRILLSYVGRLNNAKGFQVLERICKFVSESDSYWMIIQCIYLDKYSSLINEIRKKFKNITVCVNQDVKTVRYSDVHLSTSLVETTSLVTLEALFSGIPVVCTDVTEFYSELDFLNKIVQCFYKITMPQRLLLNNIPKMSLELSTDEIDKISSAFINQIKKIQLLTENQRKIVASSLSGTNFDSRKMIKKLITAYKKIEISSNNSN